MPLFFLLAGLTFAYAGNGDLRYGESAIMRTLSNAVRIYVYDHNGQIPRSWEDLKTGGQDISGVSRIYLESRGSRLEDKYVFTDGDFEVPRTGKASIVLVRTAPINVDRATSDQRLFVLVVDGKIGNFSVSETEAEKMFGDAGKELPGKGNKVDRESMVNGKDLYIAGDVASTPTPASAQPSVRLATPSQTPIASPVPQSAENISKRPSSVLVIASIVLAALLVGVTVFFLRHK